MTKLARQWFREQIIAKLRQGDPGEALLLAHYFMIADRLGRIGFMSAPELRLSAARMITIMEREISMERNPSPAQDTGPRMDLAGDAMPNL